MKGSDLNAEEHRFTAWRGTMNWRLLRSFGQSHIATVSTFMPFIGFFILYHTQVVELLRMLQGVDLTSLREGQADAGDIIHVSLFWRLNFLYLGAFFIGVGSILYRIFIPQTVKMFSSSLKFISEEMERVTARTLIDMVSVISKRNSSFSSELIQRAHWLSGSSADRKTAANELRGQKDDQVKCDVLNYFYVVEDEYCGRFILHFIALLYLVGFIFLTIPGALFTLRVLAAIWVAV